MKTQNHSHQPRRLLRLCALLLACAAAVALAVSAALIVSGGGAQAQAACPQASDITFTITPAVVRPGDLVTFEWRVPQGVTRMEFNDQYGEPLKYDLADRRLYDSSPHAWATEVEEVEGGYVWRQRLRMMAPASGQNVYTVTAFCDRGGEPLRASAVMTKAD